MTGAFRSLFAFRAILETFNQLFTMMEEMGILEPLTVEHRFAVPSLGIPLPRQSPLT